MSLGPPSCQTHRRAPQTPPIIVLYWREAATKGHRQTQGSSQFRVWSSSGVTSGCDGGDEGVVTARLLKTHRMRNHLMKPRFPQCASCAIRAVSVTHRASSFPPRSVAYLPFASIMFKSSHLTISLAAMVEVHGEPSGRKRRVCAWRER